MIKVAYPLLSELTAPADATCATAEVSGHFYSRSVPVRIAMLSQEEFEGMHCESSCEVEGEEIPLLPCVEANISIVSFSPEEKEANEGIAEFEGMYTSVIQTLKKTVGIYGVRSLVFHTQMPNTHAPMKVEDDSKIDVYIFSSPVEEKTERDILENLFRLPIAPTGRGLPVVLPACPLRGGVVLDEKKPIAQYIGNTFYILYHPETLEDRGGTYSNTCFLETIIEILHLWFEQERGKSPCNVLSPKFFAITEHDANEEISLMEKSLREKRKTRMDKIQMVIKRIETDLMKFRRELVELQIANRYPFRFHPDSGDNPKRTLFVELEPFTQHPLVQSIQLLSLKGILIKTKLVCIEHEQIKRAIGKFSILFRYDGIIDIWAEQSFHPDGIPHPHISFFSSCLGNAGDVIKLACSEYRFGDAISYYLMWLEEGYTPENVLEHPVEEWPVFNEKGHA